MGEDKAHNIGNPLINPNQNTMLPTVLFRRMIGVFVKAIMGN